MTENENQEFNSQNRTKGSRRQRFHENRWGRRMTVLIGAAAVFLLILSLLLPLRPDYSVSEKRALKQFPEFTQASVMDGSFFSAFTDWFSDTFPFREKILSLQSGMENFYGLRSAAVYGGKEKGGDVIPTGAAGPAPTLAFPEDTAETAAGDIGEETLAPAADASMAPGDSAAAAAIAAAGSGNTGETAAFETNADGTLKISDEPKTHVDITGEQAGSIYVADNCGYEIYYFNQEGASAYASMINTVKAAFPDRNIYDMLVPNSFGVQLDPNLQAELGSSNMQQGFDYVYSLLDPSVGRVPVFDTLSEHKKEYIYFHTDHHWTQLGAYYAYRRFCEAKGFVPHELTEYTPVRYSGFYGTFYFATNRAEALKKNPDTIDAYIPIGTNDMIYVNKAGEQQPAKLVNDASKMDSGNRYNCFLLGDNPLTVVGNPQKTDGSACLLIKESYGNAFAPFLTDHYQYTYIVDYRYFHGNLTELIRSNNVQDILFLNNAMAVSKKTSERMLECFR